MEDVCQEMKGAEKTHSPSLKRNRASYRNINKSHWSWRGANKVCQLENEGLTPPRLANRQGPKAEIKTIKTAWRGQLSSRMEILRMFCFLIVELASRLRQRSVESRLKPLKGVCQGLMQSWSQSERNKCQGIQRSVKSLHTSGYCGYCMLTLTSTSCVTAVSPLWTPLPRSLALSPTFTAWVMFQTGRSSPKPLFQEEIFVRMINKGNRMGVSSCSCPFSWLWESFKAKWHFP